MAFKLAIADNIDFPVQLDIADLGKRKTFKFHLQARRLSSDQARELVQGEGAYAGVTVDEFLRSHIIGWREQRLVLDEAGQPAAFGADAFDAMLAVTAVSSVIYGAYLNALNAEGGKAKN